MESPARANGPGGAKDRDRVPGPRAEAAGDVVDGAGAGDGGVEHLRPGARQERHLPHRRRRRGAREPRRRRAPALSLRRCGSQ